MDIAELLIENGAKTKVRDIDGQTPLDLAQSSGKFKKKWKGEQNSKPFSFFFLKIQITWEPWKSSIY